MPPIYITLTQYQAGQLLPRALDANISTHVEAYQIESTQAGARIELAGNHSMIVCETLEQIKILTTQAAHYA